MSLIVIITSSLLAFYLAKSVYARKATQLTRHNAFHKNIAGFSFFILIAVLGFVLRILSLNYEYAYKLPLYPQAYAIEIFLFGLNSLVVYSSTLLFFITLKEKKDRLSTSLAILFIYMSLNSIYLYHTRSPQIKERQLNGVILQSDPMSCAAASLANISHYFQMPQSERTCVKAIGTSVQGSSPAQIVLGARKLGFEAKIVHNKTVEAIIFPAILFVDAPLGKEKHALVIMNKVNEFYEIWDPDKGRVFWSAEYLDSRWHGNGIEIYPKP